MVGGRLGFGEVGDVSGLGLGRLDFGLGGSGGWLLGLGGLGRLGGLLGFLFGYWV